MKLLMIDWDTFVIIDILMQFNEWGVDYDVWQHQFVPGIFDEEFEAEFGKRVVNGKYDGVFSVNYFSQIAKCCYKENIKYISWSYDCPLNTVNIEETLGCETNYVFLFDRESCEKYRSRGFKTVYYMPLAVNTKRLDEVMVSREDELKYNADISFVGRLYNTQYNELCGQLEDYLRGYWEAILRASTFMYGYNMTDAMLTDDFKKIIKNQLYINANKIITCENVGFISYYEVTYRERVRLINELSRICDFKLYTYENPTECPGAVFMGKCEYLTEMPKVFKASKICFHQTVKGISSGIPLRCMDILGSKGLLFSNYQAELLDYFEPFKDIMIYEGPEDAQDKAKWLLSHENEREQMKVNAYNKVKELFSYDIQLAKIIKISGLM